MARLFVVRNYVLTAEWQWIICPIDCSGITLDNKSNQTIEYMTDIDLDSKDELKAGLELVVSSSMHQFPSGYNFVRARCLSEDVGVSVRFTK